MKSIEVLGARLAVCQQGSGRPVLLVHGFPLNHSMWRAQIEALAPHYHVIAPDLRGFGDSSATPGIVTMDRFALDLMDILDGLGISEPVIFCGLSMGGYVAWRFYENHRPRLAALVLCDTRAAADPPEAARQREETAEMVLRDGVEPLIDAMMPRLLAATTREQQPDIVETLAAMMRAAPVDGVAAALRGMAARGDASSLLGRIEVPTLVVVGEHDAISTAAEMRTIAGAISGAAFFQVPGAGHMAPMEAPEPVNRALIGFLKTIG